MRFESGDEWKGHRPRLTADGRGRVKFAGDLEEATVNRHGAFDRRTQVHHVAQTKEFGVSRSRSKDSDHAQTSQDRGGHGAVFAQILFTGQQGFSQAGIFGG